MFQPSPKV